MQYVNIYACCVSFGHLVPSCLINLLVALVSISTVSGLGELLIFITKHFIVAVLTCYENFVKFQVLYGFKLFSL